MHGRIISQVMQLLILTFLYHLLCTARCYCTKPGKKQLCKDSAMYGVFILEQPFLDLCKLLWCCIDLRMNCAEGACCFGVGCRI